MMILILSNENNCSSFVKSKLMYKFGLAYTFTFSNSG